MATVFPAQIDTTITLPSAFDNITPASGQSVNMLRDAILAIEQTCGVKPQGVYSTIRARLDALEALITQGSGNLAGGVVVSAAPTNGQTIIWNGINWTPTTPPTTLPPSGTAGGDLGGTYPNPSVVAIRGNSISATSPTDGFALIWNAGSDAWKPTALPATLPPSGAAGGNLSGTYPNPVVVSIQSNSIKAGANTASQDGYVLTWVNTDNQWEAKPAAGGIASIFGDVTGTTSATTVVALQGNSIKSGSLDSSEDGYVLTWVNTDRQWEAAKLAGLPPSGFAGGDLGGTYPDPNVAKIQGNAVLSQSLGASEDGYVLTWVNSEGSWEARNPEAGVLTRNVRVVVSDYTIQTTDAVISVGVIGSSITISLPSSPLIGETYDIKDGRGSAATNDIIVNGSGFLIDGAGTYILMVNYECITVTWDGGEWIVC